MKSENPTIQRFCIKKNRSKTTPSITKKTKIKVSLARLTSIDERVSIDERNRLVFETVLNFLVKADLVNMEPVIRLDVDFEMFCISFRFDRSMTDFEIFLRAAGVKLVSNMPTAASASNKSGRYLGQI